MTEDLHNDMDELFRSGLEGSEDMPSPNVWTGIEQALPPASAPLPPTPSTPPAAGGWTSTIIFKGLIGAAVVAILGIATYRITSNKNEANISANHQPKTENTANDAPVITDKPVPVPKLQAAKTDAFDEKPPSNIDAETPIRLKAEADKNVSPSVNSGTPTLRTSPETQLLVKPSAGSPDDMSRMAAGSTIGQTTVYPVRDAKLDVKDVPKPLIPTRMDIALRTNDSGMINVQKNLPSANNTPESMRLVPKAGRINAIVDRRTNALSSSNTMPSSISYSVIPSLGIKATTESTVAGGNTKAASLKRNDWKSRIYLAPVFSLNMTKMDVQENRDYGPRIGREHIEFKETEQTKTTVSPGIIAGFSINPRISVQTGISEFRNNISVSPKQIKAVRDRDGKVRYRMDCSSGSYFLEPKTGTSPLVGDSLRISSSEIRMRYVTIPLSVRVNFGNDKVKIFATAGSDINILAGKQTTTSLSPASGEKISPIRSEGTRKQYINGTLGAGVEIKAGKRLGILLMPQYRFPMGNMNEEGPVLTYPKTFSFTSGVRIGF
jgi:hypothetical protein